MRIFIVDFRINNNRIKTQRNMNTVSKLLTAALLLTSCLASAQERMVVLINESPATITLDGDHMTSAEMLPDSYMADYEHTPAGMDIFTKVYPMVFKVDKIQPRAIAQVTSPRVRDMNSETQVRSLPLPIDVKSLEE